jgi:hypothetical protein
LHADFELAQREDSENELGSLSQLVKPGDDLVLNLAQLVLVGLQFDKASAGIEQQTEIAQAQG